jgi:hypothetical protein
MYFIRIIKFKFTVKTSEVKQATELVQRSEAYPVSALRIPESPKEKKVT